MSLTSQRTYVKPCVRKSSPSLESMWLSASDFGEYYSRGSDFPCYPCLTPVYNGEVLAIQPELLHASLSGISIKHYYGKCFREEEEEDEEEADFFSPNQQAETYHLGLMGENDNESVPLEEFVFEVKSESKSMKTSSGSFEYRDELIVEGQPMCTVPRINHRNSFWDIHRPELSKLTWGQNYVGASTVIEHLHEHLVTHGSLCVNFHTEEDRQNLLNRELNEYVRLKVLAPPRELPPDLPYFSLEEPKENPSVVTKSPKCKTFGKPERKPVREPPVRFIHLNDDEDDLEGKNVRRSKEEFCITIGKHIRKPPVSWVPPLVGEDYVCEEMTYGSAEEASEHFRFDWHLYQPEESYGESSEEKCTDNLDDSETETPDEPCPPLMMDEFCRAAGKVDLSDLRCNPDAL